MKFSELPIGTYGAQLTDFGLEEVEAMGGKIQIVLAFDIDACPHTGEAQPVKARFKGFLEAKDDSPNKKTIKTLITCGFKGSDPLELNIRSDALDKSKMYSLAIEKDKNGYNEIAFVNDPNFTTGIKKTTPKKRVSAAWTAALNAAKAEAGVRKDDGDLPF